MSLLSVARPVRHPARATRTFVLALALAALVCTGPAWALEAEAIVLSDAQPKVHQEQAPIAGNDPSGQALTPTIANCRDLPGNVLFPIEMKFKKDFGHILEITISWQAPEANDIDIYFFDEAGEIIADSPTGNQPEVVRLGSLANGQYYLCVRNFSGPNTGFVLDASVRFLSLPTQRPAVTDEPANTAPPPPPAAAPTPNTDKTPEVTAEAVATIGPDGPFADRGLVNVAGSRQAARDEGGRGLAEIVFIGLTALIAAGGLTLVALRIRRDTRG